MQDQQTKAPHFSRDVEMVYAWRLVSEGKTAHLNLQQGNLLTTYRTPCEYNRIAYRLKPKYDAIKSL